MIVFIKHFQVKESEINDFKKSIETNYNNMEEREMKKGWKFVIVRMIMLNYEVNMKRFSQKNINGSRKGKRDKQILQKKTMFGRCTLINNDTSVSSNQTHLGPGLTCPYGSI